MENNQIIEGNKLIATFMGWKYCENDLVFNSKTDGNKPNNSVFSGWVKNEQPYIKGVPLIVVKENRSQIDYLRKLQYNSSWDWLMPVVRKIVELCCADDQDELSTSNEYTSILDTVPCAVIEDAYKVVVEFIEYYNFYYKTKS